MSVVALAFHEQLATEKLDAHYRSPGSSARSDTCATACRKCRLTFAVVLLNRADKRNADFLELLRDAIEADCIAGLHRDEYVLKASLPS
jgi:hypothetical protein